MKILVSWLRELVDVPGTPLEIAARMSVRGFAVEGIESIDGGDAVIDFEVTANRPDCLSVIGMAREVATAWALPLKAGDGQRARGPVVGQHPRQGGPEGPPLRSETIGQWQEPDAGGLPDISIDAPDLCPRYVGALADIRVAPSPSWMQRRLRACGVRPINNIVDITNYVLLECGQPMHAFDYDHIGGGEIRVRRAAEGETIRTLDDVVRPLTPETLVIADRTVPVAIAGVMGGGDAEVSDQTTTILLEAAYFDPLSVRRTSRRVGLKTEASMRFERGGDPSMPAVAMARACHLIEQIGAGHARGGPTDVYPAPILPRVLRLRRSRIAAVLGTHIANEHVHRILESLGFDVVSDPLAEVIGNEFASPSDGWDVTVPTRRVDVLREIDLIEELARHYGFDRIPATFPTLTAAPPAIDPRTTRARRLRSLMTGLGFSEAVTFGFMDRSVAELYAPASAIVPIANPLSENFSVLRPSLVPGLMGAVAHNRRREQHDVRLFEIGARFGIHDGERHALAFAWSGDAGVEHWSGKARSVDFFDIKGLVESLQSAFGIKGDVEPHDAPSLAPGRSAALVSGGTVLAVFGHVAAAIAAQHGMSSGDAVYVAELDLDALEPLRPRQAISVAPLPRHPSVTRDVSLLIPDTLPAATVRDTIRQAGSNLLVSVREFDRYQGAGIPDGHVSLSIRLTFRAPDRTLTDAEVQGAMDAVLSALARDHGAVQR